MAVKKSSSPGSVRAKTPPILLHCDNVESSPPRPSTNNLYRLYLTVLPPPLHSINASNSTNHGESPFRTASLALEGRGRMNDEQRAPRR